jgi:hypothetical protein
VFFNKPDAADRPEHTLVRAELDAGASAVQQRAAHLSRASNYQMRETLRVAGLTCRIDFAPIPNKKRRQGEHP